MPNLRNDASMAAGATPSVASMVPMLLDLASAPATVRLRVAWSSSSRKASPERGRRFGTTSLVSGVIFPWSIAVAIDMTLPVEPGS